MARAAAVSNGRRKRPSAVSSSSSAVPSSGSLQRRSGPLGPVVAVLVVCTVCSAWLVGQTRHISIGSYEEPRQTRGSKPKSRTLPAGFEPPVVERAGTAVDNGSWPSVSSTASLGTEARAGRTDGLDKNRTGGRLAETDPAAEHGKPETETDRKDPMDCGIHRSDPFVDISDLRIQPARQSGTKHRKLRVGFGTTLPLQGESIHIIYDGIVNSKYMELVQLCNLVTKNSASVQNQTRLKPILHHQHHHTNCTVHTETHVELWILDVIRARNQKEFAYNSFLQQLWFDGIHAPWKLLLVEYSDRFFASVFYDKIQRHSNITDPGIKRGIRDKPHIRTATRMIVRERFYNTTTKQMNVGYLEMPKNADTAGGPTKHTSYTVRSDLVHQIKSVVKERLRSTTVAQPPSAATTTALASAFVGADHMEKEWNGAYADRILDSSCLPPPYSLARTEVDVAHFWPIVQSGYGYYRNDVTQTVRRMGATVVPSLGRRIKVVCEVKGKTGRDGRNLSTVAYAQALLSTKIAVVTGRDNWEDHYRLMEALAAGSLVLSDVMLSLPKGLEDGKSIVFFTSLEHLKQLIVYYLDHEEERRSIAKRGWEVAMGYHRSWHRLEELTFGCPLTTVDEPYAEFCP